MTLTAMAANLFSGKQPVAPHPPLTPDDDASDVDVLSATTQVQGQRSLTTPSRTISTSAIGALEPQSTGTDGPPSTCLPSEALLDSDQREILTNLNPPDSQQRQMGQSDENILHLIQDMMHSGQLDRGELHDFAVGRRSSTSPPSSRALQVQPRQICVPPVRSSPEECSLSDHEICLAFYEALFNLGLVPAFLKLSFLTGERISDSSIRSMLRRAPCNLKESKSISPLPTSERLIKLFESCKDNPGEVSQIQPTISKLLLNVYFIEMSKCFPRLSYKSQLSEVQVTLLTNSACAGVLDFILESASVGDLVLRNRIRGVCRTDAYLSLGSDDKRALHVVGEVLRNLAPSDGFTLKAKFHAGCTIIPGESSADFTSRIELLKAQLGTDEDNARTMMLLALNTAATNAAEKGDYNGGAAQLYARLISSEFAGVDIASITRVLKGAGPGSIFNAPLIPISSSTPTRGAVDPGDGYEATTTSTLYGGARPTMEFYNMYKIYAALLPEADVPDPDISQHPNCWVCNNYGLELIEWRPGGPPGPGKRFKHNSWRCPNWKRFLTEKKAAGDARVTEELFTLETIHPSKIQRIA